jgi:hypothetical protein
MCCLEVPEVPCRLGGRNVPAVRGEPELGPGPAFPLVGPSALGELHVPFHSGSSEKTRGPFRERRKWGKPVESLLKAQSRASAAAPGMEQECIFYSVLSTWSFLKGCLGEMYSLSALLLRRH